ncbi:family 20 glycosylhydrolase [Chitinophaga sp. Cy-1792]|nr:family 20 glycosylhydrolase [Chitinophaga sp. Cy-1792]
MIKKLTNWGLLLAVLGLFSCSNSGKTGTPKGQVSIIPMPVSVKERQDSFLLDKHTVIFARNEEGKQIAVLFNSWLKELTGYELELTDKIPGDNGIIIETAKDTLQPEGYILGVSNKGIIISGSPAGAFYGMQSLIQLLPTEKGSSLIIPGVDIQDNPRFAYRGQHLDVCRHFFSVDFLKKFLDLMAMHKYNTFHWHLTDDQGWRIEIKKYPRLQEVASKRKETMAGHYEEPGKYDGKPYGGFYTQEQVKEIVKYAADRHITVIPEIEMPGHALAALAAYPNLGCTGGPYEVGTRWGVLDDVFCAGNDSVYTFLEGVLDEVLPLFPSKYIHIGGDECPKVRWQKCPKCQARMKQEGLKDEHALQSYFIQRMEKYLNGKGRQIIGWDEILEGGLAPNATVMSWRGIEGGIAAAKQHHDVIMTPGDFCYFDKYQSKGKNEPLAIGGYLPVSKVYGYEPVPKELTADEAKYIKGAQANLWTEYIGDSDYAEYMEYPRAAALAEVLWSQPAQRNYDNFVERLKVHVKRLDLKKVNYAKHVFEVSGTPEDNKKGGVEVKLDAKLDGGKIFYTTDSSAPTPQSQAYTAPVQVLKTGVVRAQVFQDGKPFGNEYNQPFLFHKALGKKVSITPDPEPNYNPGSSFALVNGIQGIGTYNDGQWFGFKKDFTATVDLDSVQEVKMLGTNVLSIKTNWIYAPKVLTFSASEDGKTFKEVYKQTAFSQNGINQVRTVITPVRARYIKMTAQHFGMIPAGAEGAGNPAWLFVDEMIVN